MTAPTRFVPGNRIDANIYSAPRVTLVRTLNVIARQSLVASLRDFRTVSHIRLTSTMLYLNRRAKKQDTCVEAITHDPIHSPVDAVPDSVDDVVHGVTYNRSDHR